MIAIPALLVLIIVWVVWSNIRTDTRYRVAALRSQFIELVMMMEGTAGEGHRKQAEAERGQVERFAVDDALRFKDQKILVGKPLGSDLSDVAVKLMERHGADAKKASALRRDLRAIIMVFLLLMEQRDVRSAWLALLEYMRSQSERGDRSAPNVPMLKDVFDVSGAYPTGGMVRNLRARGLRGANIYLIERAVKRGRSEILNAVVYHRPTGGGRTTTPVYGEAILVEMRRF